MKIRCQAVPCHCAGMDAQYVITYPNGEDYPVSRTCADMAIMCGYRSRRLAMGDIMAGKFSDSKPETT